MKSRQMICAVAIALISLIIFLLFGFKILDEKMVNVVITLENGKKNDISRMYFNNGAKGGEYVFGGEGNNTGGTVISEDPVRLKYILSRQGAKSIRFDINKTYQVGTIVKVSKIEMTTLGFWRVFCYDGNDITKKFACHDLKITIENNIAILEVTGKDPYIECSDVNLKSVGYISILYIIGGLLLSAIILISLVIAIKREIFTQFILTSGFLIMISFALVIGPDVDLSGFYENRTLASKPELSINSVINGTYTANFTDYYNDHVPLRKLATRMNSSIQYFLFHSSFNLFVEPGKNGWIFYRGTGDIDALSDYTGANTFTEAELKQYSKSLIRLRNYLAEKNIRLYIMIPPNKSQIYSEYVPDKYVKVDKSSGDLVTEYLSSHTDLNIVNIKKTLLERKKDYLLYCPTDAHWNSIGAYLAFTQLMRAIDNAFVPQPVEELNPTYFNNDYSDLSRILNIGAFTKNTWASLDTYKPKITYEQIEAKNYQGYDSNYLFKSTAENNKKLLMLRDSYADALIPFLNKEFITARYIRGHYLTKELIEKESPSVVVIEILERQQREVFNQLNEWEKYSVS